MCIPSLNLAIYHIARLREMHVFIALDSTFTACAQKYLEKSPKKF